jgi:hypothetical protein
LDLPKEAIARISDPNDPIIRGAPGRIASRIAEYLERNGTKSGKVVNAARRISYIASLWNDSGQGLDGVLSQVPSGLVETLSPYIARDLLHNALRGEGVEYPEQWKVKKNAQEGKEAPKIQIRDHGGRVTGEVDLPSRTHSLLLHRDEFPVV